VLQSLTQQILHGAPTVILPPTLAGAGWFVRRAIGSGTRASLVAWTATEALVGMVITSLMADHVLAVLVRRITLREEMWVRFEPHVRVAGVPYDFRFYALLLLGILTAWIGINFVRSAWRLAQGDTAGWRLTLRTALATVALVGPLLPLSEFPFQVLAMALLCAICAAMARREVTMSPAT
jgi:hypothetical protein